MMKRILGAIFAALLFATAALAQTLPIGPGSVFPIGPGGQGGSGSTTPTVVSASTDFTTVNSILPSSQYLFYGQSVRWITDATGVLTTAHNNLIASSNVFTNSPWANTTMTVSYGVADPNGGMNASTMTATGANSVVDYHQQNSLYKILDCGWFRRRTGTGTISFFNASLGSSTPLALTSSWQQFCTGPTVGGYWYIRVVTNGDAIDVYGATFSAVGYETAARPGDQVITSPGIASLYSSAYFYGPAFDYSPTSIGTPVGLRVEPGSQNIYLNSGAPATQTIAVASGSTYTVSFYGTGTLTLAGALTQVMTGSAYPARTTYTGVASTTSLVATLTSAGTMTYPQIELGSFATSPILTGATSQTRLSDQILISGAMAVCLNSNSGSATVVTNDGQAANPSTVLGTNLSSSLAETIGNNLQTTAGFTLTSSNTATWTGQNTSIFGWGTSAGSVSLNGMVTTDGNARAPISAFYLGSIDGNSSFYAGHFKSLSCTGSGVPQVTETPYTGQLVTRTVIPNFTTASYAQMMARRGFMSRWQPLTSFKIIIPNWLAPDGNPEAGPGGAATVTASIEYPIGTFTQVKFSGSATATISNNASVTSDAISLAIPPFSILYTRIFYQNASGIITAAGTNGLSSPFLGDAITYAASGLSDQTMGGTVQDNGSGQVYGPTAIIGTTNQPAACLVGDSRLVGYTDTGDITGDIGNVARSVGSLVDYIDEGVPGDRASGWLASHANRAALFPYCTDFIVEYGINDINLGATAATLLANLQTIYTDIGSPNIWQTTYEPVTTSTDGWVTTGNQTTNTHNAARVSANASIVAGQAQVMGFFNIGPIVEFGGLGNGIWNAPGWTPDGTHETQFGALAIKNSGVINPTLLH